MDWNDLKYFLAVARAKSLTGAATRLKVSQATVSRRITALESSLKTSLFARGIGGFLLTETGQALVAHAEEAEAHMLWIERGATSPADSLSGTIRLEVPELLGQYFIIPELAEFALRHPDIQLEIIADVRSARLSKGEGDVLIRLSRPDHGDYTIRKIGRLTLGLYCAQQYIDRYPDWDRASLTGDHRLIGWEASLGYLPMARWLEEQGGGSGLNYSVRSHTMGSQLAAAQAGIGMAVLPSFLAKRAGLERVLRGAQPFETDIWLLQQSDSHKLTRVRALSDYLSEAFAKASNELIES
ncbi:LysR family transcriptional regulator [Agrobacterium sp. NPDC090273]|uniref:LysR family transcriptional regulator n=1 Tax=Agrobacterium sp. NPDC090273 TaxID=3363919 RepID=UPI00383B8E25